MWTIMYNPLEQFDIIIIMNLYKNFTLTNFSIVLVCNFVFILLSLHNFKSIFKVDNVVFVFLNLFNLIKNLLKDNIQIKKHSVIFLFYFLFLLILISNLIGMIPYSTTVTSHLIFTLYYALGFFIGINIIGVLYHKERYFTLFLPEGVPVVVIPLLIIIEYVSYYARIISLSVRLFANMMSGHILMKILIGFVWSMLSIASIWSIISFFPFAIIFCVVGLEFCIAFLQAYVFIVLLAIYLNDVINIH